jgi:hypothetical protein
VFNRRVPILQWDDATAAKMHAEEQAEEEQDQEEAEMPGALVFV